MGIVHVILSQPQHFLPSWPPVLAKNEQLQGWFGPNHIYAWLQTAAETLQSQKWFMRKVYRALDGNCTWLLYPKTPFTAKLTPKFGQNDQFWGYSGPNNMCIWLQRAAEAFQSLNWPTSNDHDNLDRNYIWYFKSTTTFLPSWPPILTKKRGAAQGLIWPKWHVHMVADCCRSNPESKLVHEQGL